MQSPAQQSLTARQVEIANLVVAGKSNREIAEMLSLSPRTVEHHLVAIFNKLGIGSRVELTVALLRPAGNLRAVSTARPAKTDLPAQRTKLIGREAEIEDILGLLQVSRLVTVTGAGGVGKTRTALAVGEAHLKRAPTEVWFVDLAPLAPGSLAAGAIARALGVSESPKKPLRETLVAHLKPQSLLLVLDNCEHVIADIGLANEFVARQPNVRSLADHDRWRASVEPELDDVRAALSLMLEQRANRYLGTWLAVAASDILDNFSLSETHRWSALALAAVDDSTPPAIAARASLNAAASFAHDGKYTEALALVSPLPEIFDRLGERFFASRSANITGWVLIALGRVADAEAPLMRALADFRSQENSWWVVNTLQLVSYARKIAGDISGSRACLQESIRISKALDLERLEELSTTNLASLEFMAGNGRLAIEFAEAALAMSLRSKWTERGLANEINLAIYYIASDRWDDARMILHAALQAIDEQHPWLIWLLQHVAALTILESLQSPTDNRFISGLTLLGHVDSDISTRGALREPEDLIEYQRVSRALAETVSPHDLATHFSIGAMMSRHQALNLAVRLIGAESAVSR